MTGLEMATAASMKLPVICVILRDGSLAKYWRDIEKRVLLVLL